jgi:hypothetical protein
MGERERNGARAGAQIERAQHGSCAELQSPFDQELGFRPRYEHGGTDRQAQRPELLGADDIGDRLTGCAPLDEALIGCTLRVAALLVRVRLQPRAPHAERVGEQHLGVELRRVGHARELARRRMQKLKDREIRRHRPYHCPMSKRLYPPLRPQSVSEVLDSAFHIFAATLFKTLPYGILLILSGQLVNIYNLATGRALQSAWHDATSALLSVVSLIAVAPILGAMILRQRAVAQGQPSFMGVEFTQALRRLPQILAVLLLAAVAILLGMVLLILPGLYLGVALSLALPALLLEQMGPIDALKFSLHLIRGHWWRTAVIYTITLVLMIVFYFLAAILVVVAVQFIRGADVALMSAAARVLIIVLAAVSFPYGLATSLAVFGDLRARAAAGADGRAYR